MGATLDAIGGALGLAGIDGLTVVQGLDALLFPPAAAASFNNFRVHIGQVRPSERDPQADSRSLDGNAPALAIWTDNGEFLNQLTPDEPSAPKIAEGAFRDYAIEGRQGADYLSVVRTGNDGICIHTITGQSSGTGKDFVWTDDIGKACGAPWYAQRKSIKADTQNPYTPACV